MLMHRPSAAAMRGHDVEVKAGHTATSGGSIDSDTKLWAVKPTGVSSCSSAVTMVTPVAKWPMTLLKRPASIEFTTDNLEVEHHAFVGADDFGDAESEALALGVFDQLVHLIVAVAGIVM